MKDPLLILTEEQIRVRQADVRRLTAKIQELEAERSTQLQWLKAVELIVGGSSAFAAESLGEEQESPQATFKSVIVSAVKANPAGASYETLKEALLQSPLREKYERNSNSLYNAVNRQLKNKELFRIGDYFFSPERFAELDEADLLGEIGAKSLEGRPMSIAVRAYIAEKGEISASELRGSADQIPGLQEYLARNPQYHYSLLSRMHRRGELVKTETGYRVATSQNETPPAGTEGATVSADGVVAPSNDSLKPKGVFG